MFLNNAAEGGYQQVLLRQCLRGAPVSRFMTCEPIVVPPGLDLRSWVDDYVYRYHRKLFPVVSDGRVAGVISTPALTKYPRDEWAKHTVGEALVPEFEELRIAPGTDALDALARMQRTGSSRLVVMDGDRLVGIVSLKDLLGFLDLKLELEGEDR
jgi:CBS domain-containing protein